MMVTMRITIRVVMRNKLMSWPVYRGNHGAFLTNKVYFDAFKRDNSGTYPDVRKRISELLKKGQLLINYTGHGNTTAWSDEYVWTQTDILQSTYTKLPIWVTATCRFYPFR